MTKHNSKGITKKNSKAMTKHSSDSTKESNSNSYSDHLTKKSENQKKAKGTPSQRKKLTKRKRVKMRRKTQNHKNNNRTPRQNRTTNLEVNHINIANGFISIGNINFERSLNISRAFSSDIHSALRLSDLNEENNRLTNNSFNSTSNTDNNITNEISIAQDNDEELSDLSFIRNISCNHFNRVNQNLFDKLPKIKIEDISSLSHDECLICLNIFLKDDMITTLSCSHIFHSLCLKEWMKYKSTCPLCRSDILVEREINIYYK